MPTTEVTKFADKSSIRFKRTGKDAVQVTARFVYRSASYEVVGTIDPETGRAEGFTHQLTLGGQTVYDLRLAFGMELMQSEFKFGKATSGVRHAIFNTQVLKQGTLTTGSADGLEILPVHSAGCGCKHDPNGRPLLAWQDDGSAKPMELLLKAKKSDELGGLAEVVQTTIARVNNNSFWGDLVDCITYALCLLSCVFETLGCLAGTVGTPRSDIFAGLCWTTSGSCPALCNFDRTFPS